MEERDVVSIGTNFMKGLAARFIKRMIKSQLNIETDIEIDQLRVVHENGKIKIDVRVHGEMPQSDLPKLLKLN